MPVNKGMSNFAFFLFFFFFFKCFESSTQWSLKNVIAFLSSVPIFLALLPQTVWCVARVVLTSKIHREGTGNVPSKQSAGDEIPEFLLEHFSPFLMNTKRQNIIILFTHCCNFTHLLLFRDILG